MGKILRFELEQSTDSAFATGVSANLIASEPFAFLFNFSAPTTTKGLRHYFRIWSWNEAGRSPYGTIVSEQAIDVPSTPTSLKITITAIAELTVEWSIPADTGLGPAVTPIRPLHGYLMEVFIFDTPPPGSNCYWPHSCDWLGYKNLAPDLSYTFSNTTYSYVMTGLQKGKSYFVRLKSSNDGGIGNVSDAVNKPAVDRPNVPSVLSVFADKPFTINLTWALSLDTGLGAAVRPQWPMSQQRIQVTTDAAFSQNVFSLLTTPNKTNYALTRLNKGWRYYIRIFSSNMLGESDASNHMTEHAISVPSIPLGLQVLVSNIRTRELEVTWSFPSDTGLGGTTCHVMCLGGERELTRIRLQRVKTNNPSDTFVAETPQAAPIGPVHFSGPNLHS